MAKPMKKPDETKPQKGRPSARVRDVLDDLLTGRITVALVVVACAIESTLMVLAGELHFAIVLTLVMGMFLALLRSRYVALRELSAVNRVWRAELVNANDEIDSLRTRLQAETDAREALERSRRRDDKLSMLGRLAPGLAQEIGAPIEDARDEVQFLAESTRDLLALVELLRSAPSTTAGDESDPRVADLTSRIDLGYVALRAPTSASRTAEGLSRVATIIQAMENVAQPDEKSETRLDVNHAIQTMLTLTAHEIEPVADVELLFGECPQVMCHPGEIKQVMFEVIRNAGQAIKKLVDGTAKRGKVRITTGLDGMNVVVKIADNGGGILEEERSRLFDPEHNPGDGVRGLVAARALTRRQGGTIACSSTYGRGSTFTIRLPIGLKAPLGLPSDFLKGRRSSDERGPKSPLAA